MGQEDRCSKIRVVIIDDDNWIRKLTDSIQCFDKDIIIVGSVSTVEKSVEMVKTLKPDVILIDFINLSENRYDGIDTAYELIKSSKAKIIMFTKSFSENLVRKSFAAGAANFLSKSNLKLIPDTIKAIH